MSKIKKIVTGFVIQEFDTDTGKCVEQNFIAKDQGEWEDDIGDSIDEPDTKLSFPMEMIQQKFKWTK